MKKKQTLLMISLIFSIRIFAGTGSANDGLFAVLIIGGILALILGILSLPKFIKTKINEYREKRKIKQEHEQLEDNGINNAFASPEF